MLSCKVPQRLFLLLTRAAALSGGKRAASSCRISPPPPCFRILQAAAAARIAGKPDVIDAAMNGNIELVKDHVVADAGCVLKADGLYVCQLLARAAAAHAAPFNFSNFCYQWSNPVDALLK